MQGALRGLPFVLGGALALEAACEGRRRRVRTAAPARPRPRDAAGRRSAADSSPARRVEKYQASEGRGRGEGRKSTDGGAATRTKMRPPRRPSGRPCAEPGPPAPAGACLQGARRALGGRGCPGRPVTGPSSTPGGTDAIPRGDCQALAARLSPRPDFTIDFSSQSSPENPACSGRADRARLSPPPNGRLRPGARKPSLPLPPPAPPASPPPPLPRLTSVLSLRAGPPRGSVSRGLSRSHQNCKTREKKKR